MRKTKALYGFLAMLTSLQMAVAAAAMAAPVWNTFLGSRSIDYGEGVAVDADGNIYVTGSSGESWGTPILPFTIFEDAFVAKLDASGALLWSTFLGSASANASTCGIALDAAANVYVVGVARGSWGVPLQEFSGVYDAFVAKLDTSGTLTWNTFLGSWGKSSYPSPDIEHGIAVDDEGNIFVTGQSYASWGNKPVAPFSGYADAFVAKLNTDGLVQWNTFLGSSNYDYGRALALDGGGNVYVTGLSSASWGTPDRGFSGAPDAFVAKLNAFGVLQWNTFLGSAAPGTSAYDTPGGITVESGGDVYVTGQSFATWGTPERPFSGVASAYIARLSSSGSLQWNTFVGNADDDTCVGIAVGQEIAVDGAGIVSVLGKSDTSWESPVGAISGLYDVFVAQLNSSGALQWHSFLGSSDYDAGRGIAVGGGGNISVVGRSFASWGSPSRAFLGAPDAFVVSIPRSGASTGLVLDAAAVAENQPPGIPVGTLSTVDPDAGDTFTYTLASGPGGTDNASFAIVGNLLTAAASFDFETQNAYRIRVRSTDQKGYRLEKSFTVAVSDVYEGPPDSSVPASAILAPTDGANFMAPDYRIIGSADDTGSGVDKVEVSINGGGWLLAAGSNSWSYDWAVPGDGTFTIRSRATDKAGNVESPGAGVTVTAWLRAPSVVTVSGRQLLLAGNLFAIKGVVYSPVPVGDDPETGAPYGDYLTSAYAGIQDRDLSLLRQMGANAVLIPSWGNTADHRAFLDKAYNGGLNPVYVLAGFRIDPTLDIDPASPANVRERLETDFTDMVDAHRNHPAIMFWAIGSDLNAPEMYGGNLDNLLSLVNELAGVAHAAEGGSAHPVVVLLADTDLIATIAAYDVTLPNLDLWGASVYRGDTFGSLFADYVTVSSKPLAILGYGIDAFDSTRGDEYERLGTPLQGDYAVALWQEIEANAAITVGGTITEYSDQWWRGKYSAGEGCPDADPAAQGACGHAEAAEPDGFLNKEWQGIVRIADNGDEPDQVQPREAYYALQSLWAPAGLNPAISESPQILPSFGSVNLGQVSALQMVTFANSGSTNLAIGTIAIAGTHAADFATRNDGCTGRTLVPGDSCTVGVVFTPTARNTRSATLSVPSSDLVRATLAMGLQGSGIDTLPPSGKVTINSGAAVTRVAASTLTLTADHPGGGPIRMCISNTATCSAWNAFVSPKRWTLPSGNGTKSVRVWFRDQWGNTSAAPIVDTIVLDSARPSNGKVTVAHGVAETAVSWSGFTDGTGSGITGYRVVSRGGKAPASCVTGAQVFDFGSTTRAFVHTGLVNGMAYGYRVCAIDAAGNMSSGATASGRPVPEIDPPTGSVTINGGSPATRSASSTLTLVAGDAGGGPVRMCISNTGTCSSWMTLASPKGWTLPGGNGMKTVTAWFRDQYGNTSAPYSETILMDTVKPSNGTVTVTPGNTQLTVDWDNFTDGAGSGITGYRARYQPGTSAPASCTAGMAVPGYVGPETTLVHAGLVNGVSYSYRICAVDAAGNISLGATRTGKPMP